MLTWFRKLLEKPPRESQYAVGQRVIDGESGFLAVEEFYKAEVPESKVWTVGYTAWGFGS